MRHPEVPPTLRGTSAGLTTAPVIEHFLTPLACDISREGVVVFTKAGGEAVIAMRYDPRRFTAAVDTVEINDGRPRSTAAVQNSRTGRMYANWGDHLYRLRLTATGTRVKDRFLITIGKP